jgi:2-polyprenyl-3-methyl-5-hydroxy-6-metoxy-1,4-benzoquinol methylase
MNAWCKICGSSTHSIGSKRGKYISRDFHFAACGHCGLVAETDPCTDYSIFYGKDYYAGRGADPLVDYIFELEHPDETIRLYEWRGVVKILSVEMGTLRGRRWLDYGCGAGGLVRYARETAGADCVGYDTGGFIARAQEAGISILSDSELAAEHGRFDVITMIEVIEHIVDPLRALRTVASLLAPGGLLFLTTGNVAPRMKSFFTWRYVVPEIHVCYYSPRTLEIAYQKAGLEPQRPRYNPGWTDVIRFKILKNLGLRRRSWIEASIPWPILCRMADRHYAVSAQPLARKRADGGQAGPCPEIPRHA